MQKIVLLNPKGGSGKTTIAINLASYFAVCGLKPTLMDLDAQGSSSRWLTKRAKGQPTIHGIAAYERNSRVTRSFATRLPTDTERLVVDTPAALESQGLPDITRNATAVLVPVLPSDIDIHAAAKCISDLLLIAKIRREDQRIAVIANRVKKNTLIYKALMKFLETLQHPGGRDPARLPELHPRRRIGPGPVRDEAEPGARRHGAVVAADRLAGAAPAAVHPCRHARNHFSGEREFVAADVHRLLRLQS